MKFHFPELVFWVSFWCGQNVPMLCVLVVVWENLHSSTMFVCMELFPDCMSLPFWLKLSNSCPNTMLYSMRYNRFEALKLPSKYFSRVSKVGFLSVLWWIDQASINAWIVSLQLYIVWPATCLIGWTLTQSTSRGKPLINTLYLNKPQCSKPVLRWVQGPPLLAEWREISGAERRGFHPSGLPR